MSETYNFEQFKQQIAAVEHQLSHESGELTFVSECADHVFYDDNGVPEAVINTISYLRTDITGDRPVMFMWNGGPGSATSMLQLECFGPYLMNRDDSGRPVCELNEDKRSLLDVCDLVYVDPVGVGFSRLLNPQKRGKYYSLDGDARSNTFALVDWLGKHNRWNSPVYLCGESYGTIRVCRILEELARNPFAGNRMMLGLPVCGVVLIGLALSVDSNMNLIDRKLDLLTAALPSMAAVNWYHNHHGETSLEDFVEEAWEFAGSELAPALFVGERCSESELIRVANRLSAFTGMSPDYFIKTRLRLLSMDDFRNQVVKGMRVGLYNGAEITPISDSPNDFGQDNVPLKLMNGPLREMLEMNTERIYYTGNLNVNQGWCFQSEESPKPHVQCLKEAMDRSPDLHVLTASGLYDLCTYAGNTRYLMSHSGVDSQRITAREYAGGHGVYSSEETRAQFIDDVRRLITGS